VDAVLAADLAELSRDTDPRLVATLDDRAGRPTVAVVVELRPVEHH